MNDDGKQRLDVFIGCLAGKDVLDAGCADGHVTAYLASKGLRALGIDISDSSIKRAAKMYPQYPFLVSDIRQLEGEADFDGIWCNGVLAHFTKNDAMPTLAGFARLLRPQGVLFVSPTQFGALDGRENKRMAWSKPHLTEYTQEELDRLALSVGLAKLNDESSASEGAAFVHGYYKKI